MLFSLFVLILRLPRHIKPGGFVEQVETSGMAVSDDGTVLPDSAISKWWGIFKEIGEKTGKTFAASEVARESIEAAGFVDVHEYKFKLPLEIGRASCRERV